MTVLVLLLLSLVWAHLTAARSATWNDLIAALSEGEASSVSVSSSDSGDSSGLEFYEVSWVRGDRTYVTTVFTVSSGALAAPESGTVLSDDPKSLIRSAAPDVTVMSSPIPTETYTIGTWQVDVRLFYVHSALWLATLVLALRGPRPHIATRWGWSWPILIVPWIGAPLFLAASGPMSSLGPTASTRPLVTGRQSFLLTLLVYALWTTLR